MKKKSKKNNNQSKINNTHETIAGVPVQKSKSDGVKVMFSRSNCRYYKKLGHKYYCTLRNSTCNPHSLNCINYKIAHNTLTMAPTTTNSPNKATTYNTKKYNPYNDERYGNNSVISTIYNSDAIVTLHVFRGFLNLKEQYTIDYKIKVKDLRTGKYYYVMAAYNSRTQRYYISDTQLKWLHKNNIFPDAIFYRCNDGSLPLVTDEFDEFSIIALYGYSVGKNGLKAEDRHNILRHILNNKIMTPYAIIEHLQGLISLREDRTDKDFSVALSDWRNDIKFVNDFAQKHYFK